jgi:uncharacterized membrane protein
VRTTTRLAIVGIVSFVLGVLILFPILDSFQYVEHNASIFPQPVQSFLGFMLVGIGIWLIVQDIKPKMTLAATTITCC